MDDFDSRTFLANRAVVRLTATLTPAAVATIVAAEQTIAFAGLLVGDIILSVSVPAAFGASIGLAGARVPSAGNIALTYVNPTAGSVTPTSQLYTVVVLR